MFPVSLLYEILNNVVFYNLNHYILFSPLFIFFPYIVKDLSVFNCYCLVYYFGLNEAGEETANRLNCEVTVNVNNPKRFHFRFSASHVPSKLQHTVTSFQVSKQCAVRLKLSSAHYDTQQA